MNNTYKYGHAVNYSEVDSFYKMRCDHIFSHFQNIADLHSKEMGSDGKTLIEKSNAFWVLSKAKIKIAEFPKMDDNVTIETWPLKVRGVRHEREFLIKSGDEILVMGASEWCTLDGETKKPRRVESISYPLDMDFREDKSGTGEYIRAKEALCESDLDHTYRSSFVDIDTNKHTNNIAYLRMILNCFSPDEFEAMKIDGLQINFLSQTFHGDEIKIYKKKTDYGFYFEGKHNDAAVFTGVVLI